MNAIHAAAWPVVSVALVGVAVVAVVAALRDRWPASLDALRRGLLVILVAEAAIGLALAVRGAGPAELLHWVYGGAVIGALLVPGSLAANTAPARRSWAMALGSMIGAILVWRLWASG